MIDLPHGAVEERVGQTREAIAGDAPAVFEASFPKSTTFVAVDILDRHPGGFHLIEVKSSTSQKPEHIPDVAVQLHVLRRAGIEITQASVDVPPGVAPLPMLDLEPSVVQEVGAF